MFDPPDYMSLIHTNLYCLRARKNTYDKSIRSPPSFSVYVRERHRQKGVGRRLYSYCVKQAADAKCRVFDFIVLKENTNALNVYETFGVTPRDGDAWHLMRMNAAEITKFIATRYLE